MDLAELITAKYNLKNITFKKLDTPTNYIYVIDSDNGKYALKIYQRSKVEIEWEIDLLLHLIKSNVPIVKPVKAFEGYVTDFLIENKNCAGVLYEWAKGSKPEESEETFYLLGQIAAQIHGASDNFITKYNRDSYTARYLVTEQFNRMSPILKQLGRYDEILLLEIKLLKCLEYNNLDYGICHMDLKPDNIHIYNNQISVFDFDSSGLCWRAIEPYRILAQSEIHFQKWLEGYREIRSFNIENESAVKQFLIVSDLRNTVWRLGLAESSRGEPTLNAQDLNKLVDKWLGIAENIH